MQNYLGFWDTNGTSNLGQTTWPSESPQKKKTCWIVDFVILADHRVKLKESEKRDKLDLARELKKLCNIKVTLISIVIGVLCTFTKGTGGIGNKRTNGDHPNYSIVQIGQNTEKSPGDLKTLAVTQTSEKKPSANTDMKNSQKRKNNNNNNNNNNK